MYFIHFSHKRPAKSIFLNLVTLITFDEQCEFCSFSLGFIFPCCFRPSAPYSRTPSTRVQFIYSPCMPSWRGQEQIYLLYPNLYFLDASHQENPSGGRNFVPCGRTVDQQAWKTAFCKFSNAPNSTLLCELLLWYQHF
jgi:hypothetical protein